MKSLNPLTILHIILPFAFLSLLFGCSNDSQLAQPSSKLNLAEEQIQIASMLDSLNLAAATADFETYFSFYAPDATFMGTDASEHWDKVSFMRWAKPFFDRKQAWNFKSIDRHIYVGKNGDIAWFDELLDTQMKLCRGSGVTVKILGKWKLQQYVLSTTIPNQHLSEVIAIKSAFEDSLIQQLKH
jgi:ketosteroid isomerase-like protein